MSFKKLNIPIFFFSVFFALNLQAVDSDLKPGINWKSISAAPRVEEGFSREDFREDFREEDFGRHDFGGQDFIEEDFGGPDFIEENPEENNLENNTEEVKNNADSMEFDFFENENQDEKVFYKFDAALRILNKNTDEFKITNIKSVEPVVENEYVITVKSCAKLNIYNVENDFAFVEVTKKDKVLFKGWMSNINKSFNYPELRDLYITLDYCKKVED